MDTSSNILNSKYIYSTAAFHPDNQDFERYMWSLHVPGDTFDGVTQVDGDTESEPLVIAGVFIGCRFSLDQVTHFAMDLDALSRAHFRYIKADAARLLEHLTLEQGDADIRHIKRELGRHGPGSLAQPSLLRRGWPNR